MTSMLRGTSSGAKPGGVGKTLDHVCGSRRIAWQSACRNTETTGRPSWRQAGCSRRARAKSAYGSRRVASSNGLKENGAAACMPTFYAEPSA